ncbi:MAG: amino-acid N-acetyltransferase [gamma proteobacterium symbiont of Bathyaustriella thionipta]|nr:amino-acid N-acetyltransferase [gamma proteobacterium symbiont of Bathyaustriella thionipta]MCU7949926.1 amino-acid N-acetyltransferase [gamma proteobacterium symbiont of Bathyaustriella thionipta]MCU7954190.1 amino-acid N-acetyltransferase [gamma proteobacterium symbiont of Bathyaustriella thionipta]MCU7956478.1 amino-acid N-acetyltransferase [gamma proteobacterium symbiont of Bathyaustriella thionipta]MCU7966171.1 amino-acid N-acetyltransferase [gamma proteobacterium symbiont of Bathyaustr
MANSNTNLLSTSLPSKAEIDFVQWFRNAAPYINAFRKQTFVIYFSGDVLADNEFPSLVHDITLLNSLGVKLVLVHGARNQIEKRLVESSIRTDFFQGLRITDTQVMQVVKEVSGSIRINIEALFSTSLKYTPMAGSQMNIISGNYVTAKPKGIIDGVDYLHTGDIRKIDTTSIKHSLSAGDVILLSPIGYSPTGEIFNLNGEDVATQSSIELNADKLIFIDDTQGIFDKDNNLLHEVTTQELKKIITETKAEYSDIIRHYQRISLANEMGVKRVHIIDRNIEGALLQELFTQRGIGTLVSTDHLEDIRLATIEDVNGIIDLIKPLERSGMLVKRSRERLETEIGNFYVIEREQQIIGCGALYISENKNQAELACLAIAAEYQSQSLGEKLFSRICKEAKDKGLKQVFILTTQATHWFIEHGFSKNSLQDLPSEKQALYNYQRNSAVYIKDL